MSSRPLSPHLQIYKLPLAAIISISHRVAAVITFAFIACVGLYALLYVAGFNLGGLNAFVFSSLGRVLVSLFSVCLSFYFAAEIRYIIWGLNRGLSPGFVTASNYSIIAATAVLSVLCVQAIWGL